MAAQNGQAEFQMESLHMDWNSPQDKKRDPLGA